MEELDVVGIAAGSLRLQPSEFIESRKDKEAIVRGQERYDQKRRAGSGCSRGQNRPGQDRQDETGQLDRLRRGVA